MGFLWQLILVNCGHSSFFYDIADVDGPNHTGYEKCNVWSPKIRCDLVPDEFIECTLQILNQDDYANEMNETATDQSKRFETDRQFGCSKDDLEKGGKQDFDQVRRVWSECKVHESIDDCCGSRTFYRKLPCVRYKLGEGDYCEYSYPNALIFSFFLGIVGADRFYLGLTATAVGKLFSLGGLGIWWIVDIIFLINGDLMPADGHSWCTNY